MSDSPQAQLQGQIEERDAMIARLEDEVRDVAASQLHPSKVGKSLCWKICETWWLVYIYIYTHYMYIHIYHIFIHTTICTTDCLSFNWPSCTAVHSTSQLTGCAAAGRLEENQAWMRGRKCLDSQLNLMNSAFNLFSFANEQRIWVYHGPTEKSSRSQII